MCFRASMANRSNQIVNRLRTYAHRTRTRCVPCPSHRTRGNQAIINVLNWQLTKCRHRRRSDPCPCMRCPHSGHAHIFSAHVTSISISPAFLLKVIFRTDHGASSPRVCSLSLAPFMLCTYQTQQNITRKSRKDLKSE